MLISPPALVGPIARSGLIRLFTPSDMTCDRVDARQLHSLPLISAFTCDRVDAWQPLCRLPALRLVYASRDSIMTHHWDFVNVLRLVFRIILGNAGWKFLKVTTWVFVAH